jgi:hypothetical protein
MIQKKKGSSHVWGEIFGIPSEECSVYKTLWTSNTSPSLYLLVEGQKQEDVWTPNQ